MNRERPRVVFDCNALLQAVASESGPAAAALRLLEINAIHVYVSPTTLKELRAVLDYPAIRERNPELTDAAVTSFLDALAYRATVVRRVRHFFDYPRARQDEPYIDLAATVKADYLVSRDKDLLSLMTGHSVICKQFRQTTHPLRVLDPVSFLEAVGRPWRPGEKDEVRTVERRRAGSPNEAAPRRPRRP